MTSFDEKYKSIEKAELVLKAKKDIMLSEALHSNDPNELVKAQSILNTIQSRQDVDRKSYLIDPNEFVNSLGYRNRRFNVSYEVLRRMSLTPIINAIIKTRINQISSFLDVQSDKYGTGFRIIKRGASIYSKMTRLEKKRATEISDIILNCGVGYSWSNDDFDTFSRKVLRDSLMYDQMCWEAVKTRRGDFHNMVAVDASTIRLAESYDDDCFQARYSRYEEVKGYKPNYVQIYQDGVVDEFYPWEMCFGVRNPDSNIHINGYGTSELEELIQVITSILWADEYNRKFFSQGSAPKGILRVDPSVSPQQLQAFKQQWQAMVTGVYNSWRTPILESGKMDFINLQSNNRDMEYSAWNEYLIKLSCAIYSISPEEVGFNTSNGQGSTVFESNNESRLAHSKDKGLIPLLKFYQSRLNKHAIQLIDPQYQIVFVGYDAMTREKEMELMVKKVTNIATLDEVREELGYKPLNIKGVSDSVMSGTFMQAKMIQQQSDMSDSGGVGAELPLTNNDNPFEQQSDDEQQNNLFEDEQ